MKNEEQKAESGRVSQEGPSEVSSPLFAKKLLAEYGLRPKKRFGQNFLIDRNVLNRIIESADITQGSKVLEIGPGLGVLTQCLLESGARVVCVEADLRLRPVLEKVLAGYEYVEIIIRDFLEIDLPTFLRDRADSKWIAIGNLPYYITSPIITKLLDSRTMFSHILLMVQREVAERLKSTSGSEEYGALTVLVQFYCDILSVMRVSRNVFYPVPEVDSELVKLIVRERPRVEVSDESLFFRIVRAAFGKRRKTLENALGSSPDLGWDKEKARRILERAGIDPGRRGETLSIEEFARIANNATG